MGRGEREGPRTCRRRRSQAGGSSVHFAGRLQPCDLALAPGLRSGRGKPVTSSSLLPHPSKDDSWLPAHICSGLCSVFPPLFSLSVWQQGPRLEGHTLVAPSVPTPAGLLKSLSLAWPRWSHQEEFGAGFCFDMKPCPWLIPS